MPTLTPLDGRYAAKLAQLAALAGGDALTAARIKAEGEYFIALSAAGLFKLSASEAAFIRSLYAPASADIKAIAAIEAKTNHDVKAIEYYLAAKFAKTALKNRVNWLHFAMTSEDTNSLAYAMLLQNSLEGALLPQLEALQKTLAAMAKKYADVLLLARTHGQPAVPTTFGKEFKIFEYRLARQISQLKKQQISCKLGGAVGNYSAHYAALPAVNWPKFAASLVATLNKGRKTKIFVWQVSAQSDPHDTYAELFDNLRRANTILIDFAQDIWRYISDGLISQKAKEGETGSSTMPQKVNPIDFENAEGNLGLANAMLNHFSAKLPISRLQRDLSDSTVLRNIAPAFGYCLLGWQSLDKGLSKIAVNAPAAASQLQEHPEVLAEAVQTILRAHGVQDAYERLKTFTRGKKVSAADMAAFIKKLNAPAAAKEQLQNLNLTKYTGTAPGLARKVFK